RSGLEANTDGKASCGHKDAPLASAGRPSGVRSRTRGSAFPLKRGAAVEASVASTAAARASCVASPATYDEVRRLLVMIDKKVAMRSRTRRKARSNRLDPPVAAFRAAQE